MSRSRRKTPIRGVTGCPSERLDKQQWHKRWRMRERMALSRASPEAMEAHQPVLEREVSNVWMMGKDGRIYWPLGEGFAPATHPARKGRPVRERISMKQRVVRIVMGK